MAGRKSLVISDEQLRVIDGILAKLLRLTGSRFVAEREFSRLFHVGKESSLHVVQVNKQGLLLIPFGRDTQAGSLEEWFPWDLE